MLKALHIRDFSIIDEANIDFHPGFNVITGETGAGKSIIINALSLALGERASSEHVRSGAKEALIEAFFDIIPDKISASCRELLNELGVDLTDGIIVKRVISSSGRSRAFVNESTVNVQTLSAIGRDIIDIHGQYEHQSLLSQESQIQLLDMFGNLTGQRDEVLLTYSDLTKLRNRINSLLQDERDRIRRIDLLRYQVGEIAAADLREGEDKELDEKIRILGSAVRLAELTNRAYENLYSGDISCLQRLREVLDDLKEIHDIDPSAAEPVRSLEESIPLVEETSYFLRDYRDKIDFDPQSLETAVERQEQINNLKKKYGSSISEILEYQADAEKELHALENSEEEAALLQGKLENQKALFTKKAHVLAEMRKKAAQRLEKKVQERLSGLEMPDVRFRVSFSYEDGEDTTDGLKANDYGIDNVDFLISPNIGEELKPLSRIVSGGELSRIMLALKGIVAHKDAIPVLVFDEIDAGIGGKTAGIVGARLRDLSKNHQVICITHLPQIASLATWHLKIEKGVLRKRTVVSISELDENSRTSEIARMLSGKISDASLNHAKELLNRPISRK